MDFKSVKNKISLGAGICVLVTAFAITLYSAVSMRSSMMKGAEDVTAAVGHTKVSSIESSINIEIQVANTLAQSLSAVKDEEILLDLERQMVRGILRIELEKNPHIVGIFTCWEPNAFDNDDENNSNAEYHDATGRFAPYLYQNELGETVGFALLSDPQRAPEGVPGSWYTTPRETGNVYVSDPLERNIQGNTTFIITLSVPIINNGKFYGVVGLDMDLAFIQQLVDGTDTEDFAGQILVITNNGMLAGVTDRPELVGRHMEAVHPDYAEDLAQIQQGRGIREVMDDSLEMYMPISLGDSETPWSVNLLVPLDTFVSAATTAMWKMLFIGLVCVVLALFLIRYIVDGVVGQLSRVADLASSLADGDLTRRLNISREDEIGSLAKALDASCISLSDMIKDITSNAEMQASASQEMSSVSSQLAATSEEMSTQAESVAGATEEMSASINSMASASEEMSVNIQSVSSTAEQMSQNMNSIASSIEQMSTSIEDVALSARDGSIIAQQAMEMSGSTTITMDILGKAAKEIGEVTSLIKRIADQTNLLALNATIEAASAGEAGKGFAVVANEIKELANQSGQAANEIAKRVKGVQANTSSAVDAIASITDIIQRMNESSAVISKSVEEQTSTSIEISDSVQQATSGINNIATSIAELARGANDVSKSAAEAARGVTEVSANIQGLSRAASESNSGAQQVNTTAMELARIAAQLRELAGRFKVSAR